MNELAATLDQMGFVQLVCAFFFLTSYALAIGGLFERIGKRRAALAACAAAVAFVVTTRPWVHGAMLLAISIAGVGLFIIMAWALSKIAGVWFHPQAMPSTQSADVTPATQRELALEPHARPIAALGAATCSEGAHSN
jgi:hypothetical protein